MLLFSGQQVSEELGAECQSHAEVSSNTCPISSLQEVIEQCRCGQKRRRARMGENSIYSKDVDKCAQNRRKQMSHLKSKLSVLQEFYYRRGFLNFNLN